MKKRLLIPVFFIFSILNYVSSHAGYVVYRPASVRVSSPADTIISRILTIQLSHYIGKPVDSLLSVLPIPYTKRGFNPARAGYCRGLYQVYGIFDEVNTVTVEIFVDHFQHMVFPNRTKKSTWNMDLAKQEIISYIRVVKSNTICLYGCNNPKYED